MKVIHWSPKKNKSKILEKGILISDTWVSCSILTPYKSLNRWWLDFLLNDQEYLGFIFELGKSDFPLVHSHWCIDTHTEYDDDFEVISKRRYNLDEIFNSNPQSVFNNIDELKKDYIGNIVWRIGESVNAEVNGGYKNTEKFTQLGLAHVKSNEKNMNKFLDDSNFMEFVFEDYEILLFKKIEPKRIEKIIKPNTDYKYNKLINEIKMLYSKV